MFFPEIKSYLLLGRARKHLPHLLERSKRLMVTLFLSNYGFSNFPFSWMTRQSEVYVQILQNELKMQVVLCLLTEMTISFNPFCWTIHLIVTFASRVLLALTTPMIILYLQPHSKPTLLYRLKGCLSACLPDTRTPSESRWAFIVRAIATAAENGSSPPYSIFILVRNGDR